MPKAPHAVITGGGRGIGASVARKFKSEGYRVTVMARSRGDIDRLADEIRAYAVRIDVGDPASVEAAFMAAGPVDVLVNNAAVVRPSEVLETDVRVWEEHLKINLTGAFLCALKVLPGMINRGRGRIVNISSTAGLKGFEHLAAYCASKHGLIGFTRALAAEVGDKGVTVNAICPGFVDSPMTTSIVNGIAERTDATAEEILAGFKSRSPQGRLFSPEEVADAVFWLAGEQARGINGQHLTLDGGELAV
jgi:NAD(P)-dependent dehydrogenase (short-subunit alcohol dehydrogenase family)